MDTLKYVELGSRTVIAVGGADARAFLQGLVSNDVDRLAPGRALYAALLTPQGKYLFDFFLADAGEAVWLDAEAARRDDLLKRLAMYKLRSKVTLAPRDDLAVAALLGAAPLGLAAPGAARPFAGGIAFADPRLTQAGVRVLAPAAGLAAAMAGVGAEAAGEAAYDRLRLSLGLADGSRDLQVEKSTLLESNFEELHGVDFKKGCYVGQEVTARTKYRGLVRKRLLPVAIDGPAPAPGTPILDAEGREAGVLQSSRDGAGLALLRLEAAGALRAGEATVTPRRPDWLAA